MIRGWLSSFMVLAFLPVAEPQVGIHICLSYGFRVVARLSANG